MFTEWTTDIDLRPSEVQHVMHVEYLVQLGAMSQSHIDLWTG